MHGDASHRGHIVGDVRRARSCRKRTAPSTVTRDPLRTASSIADAASPNTWSRTNGSTCKPASATTSNADRQGGLCRAMRARTASRTVAGSASPPLARISVTKNALPPGAPVQLGRVEIGTGIAGERRDRRGRQRWNPHDRNLALRSPVADQDAQRVVGGDLVGAERDHDQPADFRSYRTANARSMSTVASSAQCPSSMSTMVGGPSNPTHSTIRDTRRFRPARSMPRCGDFGKCLQDRRQRSGSRRPVAGAASKPSPAPRGAGARRR